MHTALAGVARSGWLHDPAGHRHPLAGTSRRRSSPHTRGFTCRPVSHAEPLALRPQHCRVPLPTAGSRAPPMPHPQEAPPAHPVPPGGPSSALVRRRHPHRPTRPRQRRVQAHLLPRSARRHRRPDSPGPALEQALAAKAAGHRHLLLNGTLIVSDTCHVRPPEAGVDLGLLLINRFPWLTHRVRTPQSTSATRADSTSPEPTPRAFPRTPQRRLRRSAARHSSVASYRAGCVTRRRCIRPPIARSGVGRT